MPHQHSHSHPSYNRAFVIGISLNLVFVIAEAAFGILSDSLALLADAGHNLSDIVGLLLAWGSHYLSRRPPTRRRTYGWKSSTILAALLNAVLLMVVIGGIGWEAIRRFFTPAAAAGNVIIVVAAIGVVINTLTALLFITGRKQDLNIRGAFLHMAADAGVSAGVVLAGFGLILTGWLWIDPAISLVIAALILVGTWSLLKESLNLALQAVPAGIDTQAVKNYLSAIPGVTAVHDLHIWAMSTNEIALTAHLVKPDPENDDLTIEKIRDDLLADYGIHHITVQYERRMNSPYCGDACSPQM